MRQTDAEKKVPDAAPAQSAAQDCGSVGVWEIAYAIGAGMPPSYARRPRKQANFEYAQKGEQA